MYLDHFGLSEIPFRITPHTDFFFSGANRGATLDALLYAVTHDEGIVKVSGEVGSGKTMLCRVLMERLPNTVAIVYLANPSLSRDDILYAIADELNLKLPENLRSSAVIRALQEHLIALYGQGRRVVVLVDEAHAMPAGTLEEIRLLSNLESNRHKLLQLVLFGQPELNDILARADMRQLKERITHNFQLEPLVRDDVAEYLEFRLRTAGYKGPNVFSPQATKLISEASLGLTRRINILADKTLLAAYSDNTHQITTKHVRAAIRDCEFSSATHPGPKKPGQPRWAAAAALAITLIGASYFMATRTAPPIAQPPAAVTPPPAQPVSPTPTTPPPPTGLPPPPPAATNSSPVATTPAPPIPETPAAPASLLDTSLKSGKDWIAAAPGNRWFVQLFAVEANRAEQAEQFLRKAKAAGVDMEQTRAYLSDLSGRMRYGVIYGDYASPQEARAAIQGLPADIRDKKPFIRPINQLR
ncbi:MAG: ATPase [Rhodocyclaceae bacterium]|nr:MAG: ATPase [Rhodocyclaceae bacterium]